MKRFVQLLWQRARLTNHSTSRLVAILCFCWGTVLGQNPVINWDGKQKVVDIAEQALILKDTSGRLKIAEVASPTFADWFTQSTQKVLSFNDEDYYWVKVQVRNATQKQVLLEIAQPILSRVDFYYQEPATQKWHVVQEGFMKPIQQKAFKHQYQLFLLPPTVQTYYLRFQSLGLAVPLRLWNEDVYEEKIGIQRIVFGIFTGIMGFVVILNFFFFFSLQKPAYAHYAVLVFIYYLTASNVEGFLLYVYPKADLFYGMFITSIFNMPIGVSFVLFFLEIKKVSTRLYTIGWGFFIYYLTFIFWHRFLSPLTLAYVTNFHGLMVVLIMATFGIQAGRKGNRIGYYFFVSYLLFFLLAALDTKSKLTGTPAYIFDLSYVSLGFLTEAITLSYLLTKRFEWEGQAVAQERLKSQELLLAQTRENERIVREQNVILEQKVAERTRELVVEKKKSDDLLLNILPSDIADELKATGRAKARKYESASVLFADFKDFTLFSQNQSAEKVVAEIDHCFRAFDIIVKNYGLEKIKTIGDAYMCAGGLPTPNDHHAQDIVRAALEICAFMKQLKAEKIKAGELYFEVRVGICSGPVVAGIVGINKFAYDIWGDTVNTAARMEQHSEPGKVNVSGSTYELIKEAYNCIPRGKIAAKNKGEIEMYFVE